MDTKPYEFNIDQNILDDLSRRLYRTRWINHSEPAGWNNGADAGYMKEIVNYWLHNYDWRRTEGLLNEFPWFSTEIEGNHFNFIHLKSKEPDAVPIVLFHGWPDSVIRFIKLLPILTDPVKYGGDPGDAFDVIIPSFIGSPDHSPEPLYLEDISELTWKLMTRGLGYKKFAVGGSSPLAQLLGVLHPDSVLGLHLTDIGWHRQLNELQDPSEKEMDYLHKLEMIGYQEGAYAMLQGSKPGTIGISLNDSPVGMAAWLIEKFYSWSNCNGNIENIFTKDELLTNIMFYWIRNSISTFSYYEEFTSPSFDPEQVVDVPVAICNVSNDPISPVPPKEFASRYFKDIRQWTVLCRGGHFVSMENPELFAADIRSFFQMLR